MSLSKKKEKERDPQEEAIQIITRINEKMKEPHSSCIPYPSRSPLILKEVDNYSKSSKSHRSIRDINKKYIISDFKLFEDVGVGAYARVVRAYNKIEDRDVALKTLPKENIAMMKHSDHVVNEREVLGYLSTLQMKPRDSSHDNSDCPFIMEFYSSF